MSLKYVIRPMMEDDTFAVALIEQGIFSLPWSQKSFADACRNQDNVYLVCEADGVIAGYCGMWTVLGEGNITNMAVSPDYRQCGIAQMLNQWKSMVMTRMSHHISLKSDRAICQQ